MLATPLTREQAIERIAASAPEIRALGVQRLALFGSVARDEACGDSDVDLLVQFSPGARTYDRFLALSDLLEARLGRTVELVWDVVQNHIPALRKQIASIIDA